MLGTVGYMSPEQVRGEAADHRTDIFSLGAVLYEMLTAKPPFRRESATETMHAVLKEDPAEIAETSRALLSGSAAAAPSLSRKAHRGPLPIGARSRLRLAGAHGARATAATTADRDFNRDGPCPRGRRRRRHCMAAPSCAGPAAGRGARQVNRGAPLPEPKPRSRERLFRRWDHRGHPHAAGQGG